MRGAEHPDTVSVEQGRAQTLHELGRYEDAIALLRETERGLVDALGEDHPHIGVVRQRLVAILSERGLDEEAARIRERLDAGDSAR